VSSAIQAAVAIAPDRQLPVSSWLNAVESDHGPAPQLRHLAYLLARHMGGPQGCFLGVREVAKRAGLSKSTAGRRLTELRASGWVTAVPRRSQYGRESFAYYPALPTRLSHLSRTCVSQDRGTCEPTNGPELGRIVPTAAGIVPPSVGQTLELRRKERAREGGLSHLDGTSMSHDRGTVGGLPAPARLAVDAPEIASEGVDTIDSDASLEAQARAYAHGAPDPEAAYRGALERLRMLRTRQVQPQEASTLLQRMSSAKVLRRGGRLHR
jgi:hypothetical protein